MWPLLFFFFFLSCGFLNILRSPPSPSPLYFNILSHGAQKHALTGGHVIMLGPNNTEAALEAVKAYPQGLQVGGGITPDNAMEFIRAGASHVIVTSYVFRDGQLDFDRLGKLVRTVGKEKLVLDLSCRRKPDAPTGPFYVVTDRWQMFTTLEVSEETLKDLAKYCAEFLVHGVDVEGKRCGIEKELVGILGKWSPIPVTYAGGVRDTEDLDLVRTVGGGKVDVTVGSALDIFGGSLSFDEVVSWSSSK